MTTESTSFDWRTRLKSSIKVNQDDPHFRFIQMATVTSKGEPRNRTIVFRGFDDDQESLLFCTDRRSRKVDELSVFQSVELCWYFLKSREQYRLNGSVQFVQKGHQVDQIWSQLSSQSKAQFYWPTPRARVLDITSEPAEIYPQTIEGQQTPKRQPLDFKESSYPSNFLVMKVVIKTVDYLILSDTHQRFVCRQATTGWESVEVNP